MTTSTASVLNNLPETLLLCEKKKPMQNFHNLDTDSNFSYIHSVDCAKHKQRKLHLDWFNSCYQENLSSRNFFSTSAE